MKLISWNVNGFRACYNKGFPEFFRQENADFFCIQETKMQPGQFIFEPPGYYAFWNSADKKGYSGTAVFSKQTPVSAYTGLDDASDNEGRIITLEYDGFFLVNCYSPNAQRELARIGYRMDFEEAMRNHLQILAAQKPVILCGDLNVAHREIDLKNPKQNVGSPGFSDEERDRFTQLLDSGFTDSFRHLYPDRTDAYTWWSYMFSARSKNIGWRIDYFVVSDSLKSNISDSLIYSDITEATIARWG